MELITKKLLQLLHIYYDMKLITAHSKNHNLAYLFSFHFNLPLNSKVSAALQLIFCTLILMINYNDKSISVYIILYIHMRF